MLAAASPIDFREYLASGGLLPFSRPGSRHPLDRDVGNSFLERERKEPSWRKLGVEKVNREDGETESVVSQFRRFISDIIWKFIKIAVDTILKQKFALFDI